MDKEMVRTDKEITKTEKLQVFTWFPFREKILPQSGKPMLL